jgi:hypothetical protein
MRKSLREIARLVAAKKAVVPGFVPTIKLTAVGTDKALRLVGEVKIDADTFQCANDFGAVKVFGDVDGFLKYVARAAEAGNGVYNVEVDTGALLASSVPSNMVTWAQGQILRLNKTKVAQNGQIDKLDSQLGLMVGWENGNAAQQAKKVEVQEQRACIVTDVAAIDAEVARLTVIAAG